MNDPGLEDSIQQTENRVEKQFGNRHGSGSKERVEVRAGGNSQHHPHFGSLTSPLKRQKTRRSHSKGGMQSDAEEREGHWGEGSKTRGLYQPAAWWFLSTAFPLFCGSFGPIANLFSVCALVNTWRINLQDGSRILDPRWLLAMNGCSLAFAVIANLVLLFNFARRIRYAIAQPITISLWYLSALLLFIPIGLLGHNIDLSSSSSSPSPSTPISFTQSYYYALISAILYSVLSTLLLLSTLGSSSFIRAYPPSFSTLTHPQRTLMLQTTSLTLYIGIGALIFSVIEKWNFVDAVYWADYTLLTIGLGSDFPLQTTLGRMLLIPFTAIGITMIGLIISSVRQLVLERAKTKVLRRFLAKKRERWGEEMKVRQREGTPHTADTLDSESDQDPSHLRLTFRWFRRFFHRLKKSERKLARDIQDHVKHGDGKYRRPAWHRMEFELMRYIEKSAETTEQYFALGMSFVVIMIVWTMGAVVFWVTESKVQGWTYVDTFYFTYTTLLTVGYGDFYPTSSAGRPFFVVWSLISVPAMTVLISNMGDTVVTWVRVGTVRLSQWTILPERMHAMPDEEQADREDQANDSLASSRAAEIAREISVLAKDLNESPSKKYEWDEWERWLKILGKIEDEADNLDHDRERREAQAPITAADNDDLMEKPSSDTKSHKHAVSNHEDDWEWTWLGDDGPLFSRMTETEWIIKELCVRLEHVLEKEIQLVQEKSNHYDTKETCGQHRLP